MRKKDDEDNEDLLPPMDLGTFVRLLALKVTYNENDINRIGDKTRQNTSDIHSMKADLAKTDELQEHKIERIQLDLSVVFNRFWTVMLGLVGTILALFVESAIKK